MKLKNQNTKNYLKNSNWNWQEPSIKPNKFKQKPKLIPSFISLRRNSRFIPDLHLFSTVRFVVAMDGADGDSAWIVVVGEDDVDGCVVLSVVESEIECEEREMGRRRKRKMARE